MHTCSIRLVTLLLLLLAAAALGGCAGAGYTGDARMRWDQYQLDKGTADRALSIADDDEGVALYHKMWRQARDPAKLGGSPNIFFVGIDMADWGRRRPELRPRWAELLPETEALAAAEKATSEDIYALIWITLAAGDDRPLAAQAEADIAHDRLWLWRDDRMVNDEALRRFRGAGRNDLADAVRRTPLQRLADGVADTAFVAISLPLVPILAPMIAPR